ncbi:hypothetical protein [Psychromonas ingrahamii]|uniref:hypothetical protein n=1 Tax=Psychromonas ingrahamii TaxID=357794 RepID=UPI0012ED2730|nr:hypothetical protein [Psychromonas ingrahamii]
MKRLTVLFFILISFTTHSAELCKEEFQNIGAIYQITNSQSDGKNTAQQKTLQLWRSPKQVIYTYSAQAVSEQWRLLSNQRIQLTRYFDQFERGIEYQAADMPDFKQNANHWLSKYQMIAPSLLEQLQKVKSINTGCTENIVYQSKQTAQTQIRLNWNPHYQLPTKLTIRQGQQLTVWELTELITDPQKLQQNHDQREHYQLTDYADIGDNEADPFLAKMINQGFIEHSHSGFYNADGDHM